MEETLDKDRFLVNVLDKGFVRLVDSMGNDLSIIRAARVSYNADYRNENKEKDIKLINYLWKNKHTSPFEAVTFTFEIKAPIFVFRQWHRHRTQSYNEISARYTELPDEFYIPIPNVIGQQSSNNKQARDIKVEPLTDNEINAIDGQTRMYVRSCVESFHTYKILLQDGWPRELARMVLPVSTYSRMFVTMNLLNLFKFLTLRTDPHAQFEIREYANAICELIKEIVPISYTAWENNK